MTNPFKEGDKCCGCYACYNACGFQAMKMLVDSEGFAYPFIDNSKCVKCHRCENVCPITRTKSASNHIGLCYSAYNKDSEIRASSSSGGLFYLFASKIIEKHGLVCGAAFDKQFDVRHIITSNTDDLKLIMGSKYFQSVIGDTFLQIENHLKRGELVYFSGTPCQVEGLLSFLGKDYDNLITQDIICHGVPSQKTWKLYLKSKGVPAIRSLSFRDKSSGWENYSIRINDFKENHIKNHFLRSFYFDLSLRPSCYTCKFKKEKRISDITLGDLWGANEIAPEIKDDLGISFVMINSKKGLTFFEALKDNLWYKEIMFRDEVKFNPSLLYPNNKPANRDLFMSTINEKNFCKIVNKYTRKNFFERAFNKLKKLIRKE